MSPANRYVQTAGIWLAVASALMIVVLMFHGPISTDLSEQMERIAGGSARWYTVHWIAAGAMSLYTMTGLLVIASRSALTNDWWTLTAWAVLPIGAVWTLSTAVIEATVIAQLASSGDLATFKEWWSVAEGMGNGFAFLALAVATIAGHEARKSGRVTPAWSAWIGSVAGVISFGGWAVGMWLGIGVGNLLWVAATIVMSLWTLWFGLALVRSSDMTSAQPT